MKKKDLNFGKKDLNFGNVVELKNGELCLITSSVNDTFVKFKDYLETINDNIYRILLVDIEYGDPIKYLKDYNNELINESDKEYSIVKVYKDYTLKELLWARKKPLLTNEEREWLNAVIKPFRNKVESIVKRSDKDKYIMIFIKGNKDCLTTPNIAVMDLKFENIEDNKEYLPKELGL